MLLAVQMRVDFETLRVAFVLIKVLHSSPQQLARLQAILAYEDPWYLYRLLGDRVAPLARRAMIMGGAINDPGVER